MNQNRPRDIAAVALLMIAFGLAEVTTSITHRFFGLFTAQVAISTYIGAAIGVFYALAGLMILSMKRWAATLAIVLLIGVIVGRIGMVVTGLYRVESLKQIFAMVLARHVFGGGFCPLHQTEMVFLQLSNRLRSKFQITLSLAGG